MADVIVFKLPYHFVDFLTDPGLDTKVGRVPLKQYMSMSVMNGGNGPIDALLKQLRATNLRDAASGLTIDQTVGLEEMTLVWKGQGHASAFVKAMNFLADNQSQFERAGGELARVYTKYFRDNGSADALRKMVQDKYFGIDCIGFVANYMRYVGLWPKYYGYEIDQWDNVFTSNVKSADDVRPLNLMVWPGKHVALVDTVHRVSDGVVEIDMCQSTKGGPQCNEHVLLSRVPGQATDKNYPLFQFSGNNLPPVSSPCYFMRKPGLGYQQPERPASSESYQVLEDEFARQ